MPQYTRFNHNDKSSLYIDGVLDISGSSSTVDNRIIELFSNANNLEIVQSDSFLRGGEEPASTLLDIAQYEEKLEENKYQLRRIKEETKLLLAELSRMEDIQLASLPDTNTLSLAAAEQETEDESDKSLENNDSESSDEDSHDESEKKEDDNPEVGPQDIPDFDELMA